MHHVTARTIIPRALRFLIVLVCATSLVTAVACRKNPPAAAPPAPEPAPAPPTTPPPPPPPPPPPAPAPERPLSEDEQFAKKTLEQLNAERPLGDVRFDYDSSALSENARAILQKNAEWMKRWTSTRVSIEGHCDARGSSEYNLGLGERRADAVRDYLVSLGIAADRINPLSKGEEDPTCREENEGCWAQNRRGHSVITAK